MERFFNFYLWDKHSSLKANIFLLTGIFSTLIYQQAFENNRRRKRVILNVTNVLLLVSVLLLIYNSHLRVRLKGVDQASSSPTETTLAIYTLNPEFSSCNSNILQKYTNNIMLMDKGVLENRTLIFSPRGGLADSYAGMASSFLLAVVTRRRFFICSSCKKNS